MASPWGHHTYFSPGSRILMVGAVLPPKCHAFVLPAPRSRVLGLSYEILFVSITAIVLSESGQKYLMYIVYAN